jgi:hypothetical protein
VVHKNPTKCPPMFVAISLFMKKFRTYIAFSLEFVSHRK